MRKLSFYLLFIFFFAYCLTEETDNTTEQNATSGGCLANPLCANNQDNFTCVAEPYEIEETDFCSTFFENNTQSCCSKEYINKLELLVMPAIETDDAIEEIATNESNFTDEILDNIETFSQETEPININRIRRTLLRRLTESLSEDTTTSTSTSEGQTKVETSNTFSISNFTMELIVSKEKTLLKKREQELLVAKDECSSKIECKVKYLNIVQKYVKKIKDMKAEILGKISDINKQQTTVIAKFEAQIEILITYWDEEYDSQKEVLADMTSEKIDKLKELKETQLKGFLEKAKEIYTEDSGSTSSSDSNSNSGSDSSASSDSDADLIQIDEVVNTTESIEAKIQALQEKYKQLKEDAEAEIEQLCTKYSISEKDCKKKLQERLKQLESAEQKEQNVLEQLKEKLEDSFSECKQQGYSEEECEKMVNSLNEQNQVSTQLQEHISEKQKKFVEELEEKCLGKGYTLAQCSKFVNKTLQEANKKAEELKEQQEIANQQIQKAAEKAIKKCKQNNKSTDECKEEVDAAVESYSEKITSNIEKVKEKADSLKETLTEEIESKCKNKDDSECEEITEELEKNYEKKMKQLHEVLAQPVTIQENYEASETICLDNGIADSSDECSNIMYDKLKKIKEKNAKLGVDSSDDEVLALKETMQLYQEIKNNCSNSKKFNNFNNNIYFSQNKCEKEVNEKLKEVKVKHKEQLLSEITVNETLIDLSPLLKGKLNKQLQNQLPIKNLQGLLKKYQQARKKCFSFILKLKSKLSCLACAGPSSFDKFIKDGKLHFHKQVCQNTMKHCYDFFDLNEAASVAKNNIEALNESYSKLEVINEKVESITEIIKEIKKEKKAKSSEEIKEKIESIIDQIHEIEDLQGSKLQKKFIAKRKPKLCSADNNCSYICDHFFSAAGLNTSQINNPGIEQEVESIEETILDVYEDGEDVPIELDSNSSLSVETDDELLEIQQDTTESATISSELDAIDQLSDEIYSADDVEIVIDSGSNRRRMLEEVKGTYIWDDEGMDIELIVSGIDESLLEFDENPKDFKEDNYSGKLSIFLIGLMVLLIL